MADLLGNELLGKVGVASAVPPPDELINNWGGGAQSPATPSPQEDDLLERFGAPEPSAEDALKPALDKNPDEEAKLQSLSKQTGAPEDLIRADPNRSIEKQAQLDEAVKWLGDAPATKEFLADPKNADVASDVVKELSSWEVIARGFQHGVSQTAILQAARSVISTGDPAAIAMIQANLDEINKLDPSGEQGWASWFASAAEVVGQQIQTLSDPRLPALVGGGLVLGATIGAASTAPAGGAGAIPGALAGAAAGAVGFFVATTFQLETTSSFLEQVKLGIDPNVARYTAIGAGLINAALEVGSASVVMKPLVDLGRDFVKRSVTDALIRPAVQKAALKFGASYLKAIGAETGTEVVQELTAIAAEEIGKTLTGGLEGITQEELTNRIADIAEKTFKSMVVLGPLAPSAKFIADQRHNATVAKEAQKTLDKLAKDLQGSTLNQRSPEHANEHATEVVKRNITDPIYIPAEAVMQAAVQNGWSIEGLVSQLGVPVQTFQDALTLGADVRVGPEEFTKNVLNSPDTYAALSAHIRVGANGMTPTEAEEFKTSGLMEEADSVATAALADEVSRDTTAAPVPGQPPQEQEKALDAATNDAERQAQPGRAPVTFETAKGSTYVVERDGTTTRNKAARPEHPGDEGLKPKSDRTYYLTPEEGQRLAPPADGQWRVIDNGDGTVSLATLNNDGRWGISPSQKNVPVQTEPEVGLSPLEVWGSERVYDREAFKNLHLGNEIVKIEGTPAVKGKPLLPNTERLPGLPDTSLGPVPDAVAAAELYAESSGIQYARPPQYVVADAERGGRIAQAYEEMKHDPENPEVKQAYQALIDETLAQYQAVKQMGLNIEMIPAGMADPYAGSSRAMIEDVRKGHLWVYPTESGYGQGEGPQHHPLLAETDEFIGDHRLLANDVFRIVHDIFGHAKEGFSFGINGEENAWQTHFLMYSPQAARAMTSETRGQNSWVNFGPKGAENRANPSATTYAVQKAGLLPQWVTEEGRAGAANQRDPKVEKSKVLAENELGLRALFGSAREAGMTEAEYQRYLVAIQQAAEASRVRQEQAALKKRLRENSKEWKAQFEIAREEARASLSTDQIYVAIQGIGRERLDRDKVIKLLPDGEKQLDQLPKQDKGRAIVSSKGEKATIDPETYAELNGFFDGQTMLFAMMDARPFAQAVEELATILMNDRDQGLVSERQQIEAAIEALHNDKQAEVLAFELNQLRGAQGKGRLRPALLRQAARERLRQFHISEIDPNRFVRTAARLGRLAGKMLRSGDRPQATRAKFQQLLNFQFAQESFAIQARIEKERKWLEKFYRHRSKWTKLPGDYLDSIRAILHGYNIGDRASTGKKVKDVEAWARAKSYVSQTPINIPQRVLNLMGKRNYRDMTWDEWRELYETIKAIHHQGVAEQKMLREGEKRTLDQIAEAVSQQANANLKGRGRVVETGVFRERLKRFGREAATILLNADTLLNSIDGYAKLGPAYGAIKGGIDRALTEGYHPGQIGYGRQQKKQAKALLALFGQFSKKERLALHKQANVPGVNVRMSRAAMISVLLNSGNADNIRAMIDGNQFTQAELEAIWGNATAKEWHFAQSVWDYLDSFWPDIERAMYRRQGFAPERVEPQAVVTQHGTFRGGYYPLRYDAKQSILPSEQATDKLIQDARFGKFASSHTRRQHTIERESSGGRRVLLDLFVLNSHVDQVIYDLEVGDAVTDAFRVLHHKQVKSTFSDLGHLETWEALDLWLNDVITGEMRLGGILEHSLRWLRTGYTVSKLGWNVGTVMLQPLGLIQTGVVVGNKNLMYGLLKTLSSPQVGANSIYKFVASQSGFMEQREESFNKDIIEAQRQLSFDFISQITPGKSAEYITASLFWGIKKVQRVVDTVTWIAAHRDGQKKFGDEAKAKEYADRMVARSQASGMFSERTQLERGTASARIRQTELVRVFTPLISYFMAKTNIAYEKTRTTDFTNPIQALRWAGDMVMLYTVEALLASLIRGQWPDEDDDQTLAEHALSESVNAVFAGIPLVRDFIAEAEGFRGGGVLSSVVEQFGKTTEQVGQGEADASLRKNALNMLGILFKLPSSQINKTLDALDRSDDGDDVAFTEFLFGPHYKR